MCHDAHRHSGGIKRRVFFLLTNWCLFAAIRNTNPASGSCGSGGHWVAGGGQALFPSGPEPSSREFSPTICPRQRWSQKQVGNPKLPLFSFSKCLYECVCISMQFLVCVCVCVGGNGTCCLPCCVHMHGWIEIESSAGSGNTLFPGATLLKVVINLPVRL